jgi:hypothetical protein
MNSSDKELNDLLEDNNVKLDINNKPWNRLEKVQKIQKLNDYALEVSKKEGLNEEDIKLLKEYFRGCLDKKKLLKNTDVVYNKESNKIIDIPCLLINKKSSNKHKRFTLKNNEKNSSLKNLTVLKNKTAKNKEKIIVDNGIIIEN